VRYAGARRGVALKAVATECEARGGRAIDVPLDVTYAESVQDLARRTVEEYGRIDVWVNDAAVTVFGSFQEIPLEDFRRVLDVNVMGYVHGARAALPIMREQGRGVLVNVSSIVGVVAQPYAHAYAMSKFVVRALSASLRQELRVEGSRRVKVCAVLPATIDTPLFQHGANYTGRAAVAMPPVYTPERVARAILNLVRLPRREVVVGSMGRGLLMQSKVTPGLVERMMAYQVDRTHLSLDEPAPATSGNLYQPAPGQGDVHGGWNGARRTALRRATTAAVLLAGALVAGRRWLT
jgi:NAD(P)-dependent dehydrogenase (short-subunit alcohol dehydrogenase family)